LSAKDKASIEKHLTALDTQGDSGHAKVWRRMAKHLRRLAPRPMKSVGQQILQFYVPDGKYQMQVFVLEDKRDGSMSVYLPDVLAEAQKAKILGKPSPAKKPAAELDKLAPAKPPGPAPMEYPIVGQDDQTLTIEAFPSNTPDPPSHMKPMLGWNRKAVRVTITPKTGVHLDAVEALCNLASKSWAGK
jgi:hypothetical protein